MAPRRTGGRRSKATCEAFASRRRDRSGDPGRQHSLAHQASARLNMLAAKLTAVSIAEGPARRQSARRPSHIGPFWIRIIGSAVSQTVPGAERYLGPDAARARNRRSLSAAHCAGCGGSERRWNLLYQKVPALHREAERDTTGSFSRQPLVHTRIGARVQGKRRSAATLRLIRR